MEKQMVVTSSTFSWKKTAETARNIAYRLKAPLQIMARYYSYVLERRVSTGQTKVLTEAQAAFFLFIFPADYSLLLRAAACAWLIIALRRCRKIM